MTDKILKIKNNKVTGEKKIKEKKFRLRGKSFFLTYPKCDLELDLVKEDLSSKFLNNTICSYLIVRELHEDGFFHVHVFVTFLREVDVESTTGFDLRFDSEISSVFHGNYQQCKDKESTLRYLLKAQVTANNYLISDDLKMTEYMMINFDV